MTAPNKYDAFRKVERVIESCTSVAHFNVAYRMIRNFHTLFPERDNFLFDSLISRADVRFDTFAEVPHYKQYEL